MKELLARLGVQESVLRQRVEEDLRQFLPGRVKFEMKAIPGGASIRGYARLYLHPARPLASVVLMILSDPDPAKGIEEVMAEGLVTELPFVNVQRHLRAAGVAVPEIYYYNREHGLVYLEDLGTIHLRQLAEGLEPGTREEAFQAAIRELLRIHVDAAELPSDTFLSFKVKFDHRLLRWELDHFTEHAIETRFPGALTVAERELISHHYEAITRELLAGPFTLQHRDYMLDNLLVQNGAIRVIDFQDALMGPLSYDLACLLYDRDTSALLGPELITRLVNYYADEYEKRTGRKLDRGRCHRNFELCVIHRMLKVVGRFHYIDQVKKRPEYLRFIPFMLPVITDYLGRDAAGRELLSVFRRYLSELPPPGSI